MPYFRALKSYSHRNAPQKLIPAIIACKCVPYLVVLGFFICLSGFIPLLVKREIKPLTIPTIGLNFSTIQPNFNISDVEFNTTQTHPNEGWTKMDINTILYVCIGVGGLLFTSGLVCLVIAYYYFKLYENDRIRHIQITDLDEDHSHSVLTEPIIDGNGYPINFKSPEYQPISQNTSVVYKSTTVSNFGV